MFLDVFIASDLNCWLVAVSTSNLAYGQHCGCTSFLCSASLHLGLSTL